MSNYLKITDWSGDDKENAIKRLAKVFRMSEDDAREIMDHVTAGQTWQFKRTIAENQITKAEDFLVRLGFEVELIFSATALFAPSAETEDSSDTELAPPPNLPPPSEYAKPYKRQSPVVKFGLAVALLAGIAYGLMQTGFVKDFLAGPDSPAEVTQTAPVQPQPQPQAEQQSPAEAQPPAKPQPPAQAEPDSQKQPEPITTKTLPQVKPLPGKTIPGLPANEQSQMFSGCDPDKDNMDFMLRKKDLYQTQTDFCKGKTIAHPTVEWKCDYSDPKFCRGKEHYRCERAYRCITETPEFNKTKFKQEIIDLENIENEAKAGIANLTTFYGLTVDSTIRGSFSSYTEKCAIKDELKDALRQADLKQTLNKFSCEGDTIANPVEGWICKLLPDPCPNGKQRYSCFRPYQCVPETPEYNRARFKKELEQGSK